MHPAQNTTINTNTNTTTSPSSSSPPKEPHPILIPLIPSVLLIFSFLFSVYFSRKSLRRLAASCRCRGGSKKRKARRCKRRLLRKRRRRTGGRCRERGVVDDHAGLGLLGRCEDGGEGRESVEGYPIGSGEDIEMGAVMGRELERDADYGDMDDADADSYTDVETDDSVSGQEEGYDSSSSSPSEDEYIELHRRWKRPVLSRNSFSSSTPRLRLQLPQTNRRRGHVQDTVPTSYDDQPTSPVPPTPLSKYFDPGTQRLRRDIMEPPSPVTPGWERRLRRRIREGRGIGAWVDRMIDRAAERFERMIEGDHE